MESDAPPLPRPKAGWLGDRPREQCFGLLKSVAKKRPGPKHTRVGPKTQKASTDARGLHATTTHTQEAHTRETELLLNYASLTSDGQEMGQRVDNITKNMKMPGVRVEGPPRVYFTIPYVQVHTDHINQDLLKMLLLFTWFTI